MRLPFIRAEGHRGERSTCWDFGGRCAFQLNGHEKGGWMAKTGMMACGEDKARGCGKWGRKMSGTKELRGAVGCGGRRKEGGRRGEVADGRAQLGGRRERKREEGGALTGRPEVEVRGRGRRPSWVVRRWAEAQREKEKKMDHEKGI